MQRLEVSGAVRHIYIYVIRRLKVKRVGGRFVLDGVTPNRRKLLSSLSQQMVVITIYYISQQWSNYRYF
jgi:hypothetical protein